MEKYLKSSGKPFARGGPASKRKREVKSLKQSRLPANAAVTPGSLRPRTSRDSSAKRILKEQVTPHSDSDSDSRSPPTKALRGQISGGVAHGQAVSLNSSPENAGRARKGLSQSRIPFEPGGDRFLSSDPVDSEDEEFRGTQLAPKLDTESASRTRPAPAARAAPTIDIDSSSDSSESVEVGMTTSKRQVVASSDSEDALVTPLRRRKRFMPSHDRLSTPPRQYRKSSKIEEARGEARDLDNRLIKTTEHRQGNTKKNTFRSNLEKLRRKKAGLASSSAEEEAEGESEEQEVLDDPSDWIVEDTEERGSFLDDLPSIFQQPRQPMDQFKIAVQWEILDLLMPQGGLEPDSYFKPAITWLRDRTINQAQAALSSIWRRPFVRALQRGPDLVATETGNLGYYCDACGRTNRVATFIVTFEGVRYDHTTLEDLDSDAPSSEDDLEVDEDALSDHEAERARKERLMRREWHLGVNCQDRAAVAHESFHLRKRLREEVEAKLKSMGLFTAAKKVERSVLTHAERIELANQVTEQLDAARFQQRLWGRYKATIERNEEYIVDPNAGRRRGKYVFS